MREINLKELLKGNKIDALLVTNPVNIYYLTGFKGISPTEREALLILRKPKNILITAKLYQSEAKKAESDNLEVKIAGERNEYEQFITDSLKKMKTLGFESHDLKFAEYKKFKKFKKGLKLKPTKKIIENLRQMKTKEEIQYITKAQLLTQKCFEELLKTIKLNQTEFEIAQKLKQIIHSQTKEPLAFDPIVASGPNSALPHYVVGKRKIKKGDTLLFDFGARYKNYCADFSRTIFVGKSSSNQQKTYNLVLSSQQNAFKKIKNGVKAKKVFEAAQEIFIKDRVEDFFIHSLGHGIGLEVHEGPSLSKKSKDKLQTNMVFSVEPGLYFNWGGIRIEDLVTINEKGSKLLGNQARFIELAL